MTLLRLVDMTVLVPRGTDWFRTALDMASSFGVPAQGKVLTGSWAHESFSCRTMEKQDNKD